MQGVLSAAAAVFFQLQLVGVFDLVLLGDVVLGLTHRAD